MREAKTEKVQIMAEPSLVRRIDDWRFANRLGSRALAMRRLIDLALLTDEQKSPAGTAIPPGQGHQLSLENADEHGNK